MGIIALAIGVTSVVAVDRHYKAQDVPFDSAVIRSIGQDGEELLAQLSRDKCNRQVTTNLVERLSEHNEYAAVLAVHERFIKACGNYDELLPTVFIAEMNEGDWKSAQVVAERITDLYPADPQAFGYLAQADEKIGNFAAAYLNMQKALIRFPDPSNVVLQTFFDTARLAANAGHPCEATAVIRDYISYDPGARKTQQLETVMRNWTAAGRCPMLQGAGIANIKLESYQGGLVVRAQVNGVWARLLVDTGASTTLISHELAERAGIQDEANAEIKVVTAAGETLVTGGRADTVSVGGALLRKAPVLIRPQIAPSLGDCDGLLGLSFLGNFHVSLIGNQLRLSPL